jgi:hypothetical protein
MRVNYRHRQKAQIAPFALFAALVLVGAVALVVDAGVFFVAQRQIQNAADAAALGAAWYDNVCKFPAGCEPVSNPGCTPRCDADVVADAFANANMGGALAAKLCTNLTFLPDDKRKAPYATPPNGSNSQYFGLTFYIMQIDCDVPYMFARVFPSIPASLHVSATAMATVGYRTPTGDTAGNPSFGGPGLVGRLWQ